MISVVVPYKDSARWLRRCLDSLTKQTGDFEFLIVNDHSDDNGPEIAASYADDRFRLLDNERGAGVSGARNTGMDHARGEWITFLDADDDMLPEAWETFRRAISDDANVIQLSHKRKQAHNERTKRCAEGVYDLSGLPESWWGVWNKLFRAEFVKDIRFDEGLQYGEDGLFVLECLRKDGHIRHAEKNLTTTRHRFDNKESLSHSKTPEDVMLQCDAYEAFLRRQEDPAMKLVVSLELVKLWERVSRMLSTS